MQAAAGGVGTLAVQIAKLLGASRVIAAASTADKRDLALKLGADEAVDYTDPAWPDRVTGLLGGGAVDVALDLAGGAFTAPTIGLLTPATGRIVLGGMAAGLPQFDPTSLVSRGVTAVGYTNPAWLARPDFGPEAASALLGWIADGSLEVIVGATYPLADAAEAHRALEGRATVGKVVLLTGANP